MTDDAKAIEAKLSEGPPATKPHISVSDYVKFGVAVVAAEGEWVEIDVSAESSSMRGGAYTAAQRGIASEVAELTRNGQTLYGRMRT